MKEDNREWIANEIALVGKKCFPGAKVERLPNQPHVRITSPLGGVYIVTVEQVNAPEFVDGQTVGTTISQIGLSMRLGHSATWVSKQGRDVTGYAKRADGSAARERWEREHNTQGRTIGYRRIA